MITSTTSPLKLCHSLSAKIREDQMGRSGCPRENLNANDRILFGVLIDCFLSSCLFFFFFFFGGGGVGG